MALVEVELHAMWTVRPWHLDGQADRFKEELAPSICVSTPGLSVYLQRLCLAAAEACGEGSVEGDGAISDRAPVGNGRFETNLTFHSFGLLPTFADSLALWG